MKVKLLVCLCVSLWFASHSLGADETPFTIAFRSGQELAQSGKLSEARAQFMSALEQAETDTARASVFIEIGETYEAEGNTVAARAECEKALALGGITPDQTGQALLVIANSYIRESKWQPANAALEKVLATEGVSNSTKIKAHLAVGSIFEKYGDWDRVSAAYSAALKTPGIDPDQQTLARKPLANALKNLRRYAEARAMMKELVATESLPAEIRGITQTSLGKTFFYERSFAEARTEFAKAQAMPGLSESLRAEIQLHIGLCYYEAQDYERARPELMQVLEMPGADVRPAWDGGFMGYVPRREARLRLRQRNLLADDSGQKVLKILFIGSSQTFRGDVPELVTQLAASSPTGCPRIIAGDYLRMGTTMDRFWNAGDTLDTARGAIAAGPWDFVVLETFYTTTPENLLKYGTLFSDLIRSHNARLILYETPMAQESAYPAAFDKFHADNISLAKALQVPLAPSVQAWMEYLGPKPTKEQFGSVYADWIHATPKGAYLTAGCIYSAITGLSPVGLAHPGYSDAEAKVLQNASWTAFQVSNPAPKP